MLLTSVWELRGLDLEVEQPFKCQEFFYSTFKRILNNKFTNLISQSLMSAHFRRPCSRFPIKIINFSPMECTLSFFSTKTIQNSTKKSSRKLSFTRKMSTAYSQSNFRKLLNKSTVATTSVAIELREETCRTPPTSSKNCIQMIQKDICKINNFVKFSVSIQTEIGIKKESMKWSHRECRLFEEKFALFWGVQWWLKRGMFKCEVTWTLLLLLSSSWTLLWHFTQRNLI